jgi:hypothetical protein
VNQKGNNVLAFEVDTVVTEDEDFHDWVQRRIDIELWPRPVAM